MEEITVKKIKERIRENLRRLREQHPDIEANVSGRRPEPTFNQGQISYKTSTIEKPQNIKKHLDSLLWKYGTRYAKIIKRIPILKNIAEKHYWRMAYSQTYTVTGVIPQQSNDNGLDFAGMDWHYHGFLEQVKKEGLKGKIKLFIFKFIGFFATWQEQINRALYQELNNQRAVIEEKHRAMQDLLNQGIKNFKSELAERDKTIEDINSRLTTLSRTEDALYQELNNQRADIVKKGRLMQEMLTQGMDSLKNELADRDRVMQDLFNQRINALKMELIEKDKRLQDILHLELTNLKELLLRKDKVIDDLNREQIFISRNLELLNYEFKKRADIDISQTIKEISNKDFSPESYDYFAFENMFRGSRDTIKNRQLQYLDYISEAYQKSKGSYLLDIGCGRGEFLEILSENDIPAKGIDINEENINICKEHGLNAELSDALQFMKSIKNNSFLGITAFQVIEHLNTKYLIELIKASFQKIKDGGVVIFETVNPYSLYSLRNFFIDFTHRNPIPPDTLKFLVEASGFINVEVKFSSPVSDEMKLKGDDENIRKLNEILFGFQDYAIIGKK